MTDYPPQPSKDDEDRAFGEGMRARESHKNLSDNPYPDGSRMADQWDTGWSVMEAELEEEDE